MTEPMESEKSSPKDIAISVRNVSKEFKVYHRQNEAGGSNSPRTRGLSSLLGKTKYEKIKVLKDVSFDIMKGEMVGILGRNGAGKSTLLKIIARIIEPTSGTVKVNGNMTSLLGFQSGLNKKLTARENILQYGLILGLPKEEVLGRVDEVLEFAELEKFADVHTEHFSSGMNARLAFSTSMLVNPDILLLDEILAVGDYYFHQKSIDVFKNIRKKNGTVILVSHSLANIKQYCDRVLLLNDGRIELTGEPELVIKRYIAMGLNNNNGNNVTERTQEQNEIESQNAISALNEIPDSGIATNESSSGAAVEERTITPSVNTDPLAAPANLFPDDSPFLAGMYKMQIKKLRWRAKALIESNDFAFNGKSVLDLRCQNGQFLYAALQAGARYAEGIERQNELAEVAQENFQHQGVIADKYKIQQGNMLGTLSKIKPKTFDTVLCIGVINRLINHTGLLQQIVRMKPSYLIIDASVNSSSEVTGVEAVESSENLDGAKNIGLPSIASLELLLKTYNFKFEYIDWTKMDIANWEGLEDYQAKRRVSIVASL